MLDVLSANTKTLFDRWTVQRFQAIGFLRIALNCPSKIKEMVPFEKDLWNLVNKLKFRKIKSNFQRQLNEDIREIKRCWFKSIKNKQNCKFISFDIKDFYPTIAKELLSKCLSFAETKVQITEDDKKTIYHSRKWLLFDK